MRIRASLVLNVIGFVLLTLELFLINEYLMSQGGGWGGIPLFGFPFMVGLICIVCAIILTLWEDKQKVRSS